MNNLLFSRETGHPGPNFLARLHLRRLLQSFASCGHIRFDGGEQGTLVADGTETRPNDRSVWAHQAGVTSLALDRFDGRILVSGGTDATIRLWDLEQQRNPHDPCLYLPAGYIPRASRETTTTSQPGHKFGITKLSFYPFDPGAFLSSSHDGCLKLWATERAALSKSFNLGDRIFTHAASPIASHLLVACGTSTPAVRLVDLRAGAAVHALPAPGAGAMLSMSWSPVLDHVLATGSSDGVARIWDVRRAGGPIGVLDMEDGQGTRAVGSSPPGEETSSPLKKAHGGPLNGIVWTDDGSLIVTAGQDRKIRVWDADTGANTFAAFGPLVKNGGQLGSSAPMLVTPSGVAAPGREILYWGNETEIIAFDLREGTVLSRIRGAGPNTSTVISAGTSRTRPNSERQQRATSVATTSPAPARSRHIARNRLTDLVWRGAGGCGNSSGTVPGGRTAAAGIYSAHLDGQIRTWMPETPECDHQEEEEEVQGDPELRKRKRKVLDDAYRSLMGTAITFSGETG